jgi:hypothetical protein
MTCIKLFYPATFGSDLTRRHEPNRNNRIPPNSATRPTNTRPCTEKIVSATTQPMPRLIETKASQISVSLR